MEEMRAEAAKLQRQADELTRAAQQLEKSFPDSGSNGAATVQPKVLADRSSQPATSNARTVLNVIEHSRKTVDEIVETTGLDRKQVRAVVYDPRFKGRIVPKKNEANKTTFRVEASSH
jgi:predicted Rossmann fold nucleotide-binding protein DprA/Smf involved in DNA uptake